MSDAQLPQAVIVSGAPGEDLSSYYQSRQLPRDEVLRIDEHPNTSKTSTGIYIDDIRSLQQDVRAAKSHVRTVVILRDAARMTAQSQNALLKLLEEPRPGLHFILETHSPATLLDTIRSRCQHAQVVSTVQVELPADKAARIRFMAGGVSAEEARLARDERYFLERSRAFEQAKRFVGGTPYDKLMLIKQTSDKRDDALLFLDACLAMYTSLLRTRYSAKLRDEAAKLLEAEQAIRQNGNTKLQLLRAVV